MDHHDAGFHGPISVFLADDNLIVREGVRALINAHRDMRVVGVAADFDELVSGAEATQPQVLVTDIRMPPTFQREGIDAAKEVRKRHPGTGIVVLPQYEDPSTRSHCWPRARPAHTGPLDNSTSLMGASGCGKSTLLNLVAGLDTADEGEISVAGEQVTGRSEDDLARLRRRHIGLVFQFFNLLEGMTVL